MKKNNKILLASVLAAGFVCGGAMALNSNVASANDSAFNGIDFKNVVMSEGAAIRVADDQQYGIRFQMNMDGETYTTLEEKGASYGVAIFPADYAYEITESVIFASGSKATLIESATLSDMNKDGTYDMWGSLVNIKPQNITREFVGIGYVKVGEEYKLANAFGGDIANNTRSIYYVAQLAIDANDAKADVAKAQYIDTFDTTGKQYAYTVNHVYKKDGQVVKTEPETVYGVLNGTATANPKADGFYKYDSTNSTVSGKLYANGNTTLTLVYNDNTVEANYNAEYVKISGGKITLDATKFDVALAGLEAVYVDGAQVEVTPVSETQISIPVKAGAHEIAVYDGDKCYVGEIKVADFVIANKDDLDTWHKGRNSYVYAVVTADFDCNNKEYSAWDKNWTGTLDGLGHTISNAYFPGGFPRNGKMQPGSALKNINFNGVLLNDGVYSIFGAYMEGGLVENVTMTGITFKGINWGNGWASLLGYMPTAQGASKFTMRNVTLEFNLNETDRENVAKLYDDAGGYYGTNFENVTIISNGRIAKPGEMWYGNAEKPAITLTNSSWKNVTIIDKDDMEVLTSSEKGVLMQDGKITLDTTKFAKKVSIDDVKMGGVSVAYTLSGNMLTIPVSTYGPNNILIMDLAAGTMYSLEVTVADYLISDQATLKAWGSSSNRASKKYAILTNDIICDGSDLNMYDGKPTNTLDGLGHKVVGAYYSLGFYSNAQIQSGSVMKNITFEDITVGDPYYSLFGTWAAGGLFENVNVSAIYTKFPSKGLIFGELSARNGAMIFRNCNFSFTVPEAETDKIARLYNDSNAYYGSFMTNVTIVANCNVAGANELSTGHDKPGVNITDNGQTVWNNVNIFGKDDMETITTSEKYLALTNGNVTLDLTKLSKSVNVSNVFYGGLATEFSVADNKVTFAASNAGLKNILIEDATAGKIYMLNNVKVADVVVTNFAELKAFWENATVFANSKYAVIANDITCEATEIVAPAGAKNVGVIDGLGNTVTNMTMNRGIFFNAANVTLRDITFANFTSTNHIVKNETSLFTTGLIAYYAKNLDVINVNMTTTLSADNWLNCNNLLGYCDAGGNYGYSFVGCNFQINCREDMKATAMSVTGEMWYYKGSFTNTTITYTGTLNLEKDFAQAGAKITYSNATFTDMTGTYTK